MNKNVFAFIWSFIEGVGSQGVQLVISILLARLLSPTEFGIIAIISIIIYLSSVLSDSGLASSLIRRGKPSEDDLTTVFYMNILIGVLFFILINVFAVSFTDFLNINISIDYIRVYSLIILFTSFEQIQKVILTIDLDFKKQTKITFLSMITSGVFALYLAVHGYGIWALILQSLSASIIRCILLWLLVKWRPKGEFKINLLKDHFFYGYKLLISNLIDMSYRYMFNFSIGKFYSISQLGYYNQAVKLSEVPSITMSTIIKRVNYPIISKLRISGQSYDESVNSTILFIITFYFPLCIWVSLYSKPIVNLLLGDAWLPASYFLSYLIIAFMLTPISNVIGNVLQVEGRTDLYLNIRLFNKLIISILFYFFYDMGVEYILGLILISSLIELLSNLYVVIKYKYLNTKVLFSNGFIFIIIIIFSMVFIFKTVPVDLSVLTLFKSLILVFVIVLGLSYQLWKKTKLIS